MSNDTRKPVTPEPTRTETEADAEVRVPFFARKLGRPVLVVRSGVHGGREAHAKAI